MTTKHTPGSTDFSDLILSITKSAQESYMKGLKQGRLQKSCSCEINQDLLKACKLALNAFEKNWAIDWDDLEKAIAKAEAREVS